MHVHSQVQSYHNFFGFLVCFDQVTRFEQYEVNQALLWITMHAGKMKMKRYLELFNVKRLSWTKQRSCVIQCFVPTCNDRIIPSHEFDATLDPGKIKCMHKSWQARVYMTVSSTLTSWPKENKSCMTVEKREFAREFHRLSCLVQRRTRVVWELANDNPDKIWTSSKLMQESLYHSQSSNSSSTIILVWPHPNTRGCEASGDEVTSSAVKHSMNTKIAAKSGCVKLSMPGEACTRKEDSTEPTPTILLWTSILPQIRTHVLQLWQPWQMK